MARLTRMQISNYRSIATPVELLLPVSTPVVLVGENNAGKSNIVRAMGLMLGPYWPGNYEPEDNEFHGRSRESVIEIVADFSESAPLGDRFTQLTWAYDPRAETAGGKPVRFDGHTVDGKRDAWPKQVERDTCTCVVLEADRKLSYHLGYSSKATMLSRLMHRFHRALSQNATTRGELERLFQQVKDAFARIPEFAEFTGTLKVQLGEMLSAMTHRLEVDFQAYNPANFFHALRLQAAQGADPRALEEMGTGEQEILAIAFAYAYACAFHGGMVLVIEEPESHLHPLAQAWLARRLRGLCAEGLQVVVTTHSPHFVDLTGLEGLAITTKVDGETRVSQKTRGELALYCCSSGARHAQPGNVLPFYSAHATREVMEGFFAKLVVLVEGPTEAYALPILLEKLGLSTAKEGIAVIAVGGKGQLGKWLRLFSLYEIPCYVVFDNDARRDPWASKRHDVLRALDLDSAEYATIVAGSAVVMRDTFAVFGTNFESAMRSLFPDYATFERQAAEAGLDPESKPIIARWVAEHLSFDARETGWRKLGELQDALKRLLLPSAEPSAPPAALAIDPEDDLPF